MKNSTFETESLHSRNHSTLIHGSTQIRHSRHSGHSRCKNLWSFSLFSSYYFPWLYCVDFSLASFFVLTDLRHLWVLHVFFTPNISRTLLPQNVELFVYLIEGIGGFGTWSMNSSTFKLNWTWFSWSSWPPGFFSIYLLVFNAPLTRS